LFLACQHLSPGTNLRECQDQNWFKARAVPVFRLDSCKMRKTVYTGTAVFWYGSVESAIPEPADGSCGSELVQRRRRLWPLHRCTKCLAFGRAMLMHCSFLSSLPPCTAAANADGGDIPERARSLDRLSTAASGPNI
jgi:hypothetical protein